MNLVLPTEDSEILCVPTRMKLLVRTALGPPGLAIAVKNNVRYVVKMIILYTKSIKNFKTHFKIWATYQTAGYESLPCGMPPKTFHTHPGLPQGEWVGGKVEPIVYQTR